MTERISLNPDDFEDWGEPRIRTHRRKQNRPVRKTAAEKRETEIILLQKKIASSIISVSGGSPDRFQALHSEYIRWIEISLDAGEPVIDTNHDLVLENRPSRKHANRYAWRHIPSGISVFFPQTTDESQLYSHRSDLIGQLEKQYVTWKKLSALQKGSFTVRESLEAIVRDHVLCRDNKGHNQAPTVDDG